MLRIDDQVWVYNVFTCIPTRFHEPRSKAVACWRACSLKTVKAFKLQQGQPGRMLWCATVDLGDVMLLRELQKLKDFKHQSLESLMVNSWTPVAPLVALAGILLRVLILALNVGWLAIMLSAELFFLRMLSAISSCLSAPLFNPLSSHVSLSVTESEGEYSMFEVTESSTTIRPIWQPGQCEHRGICNPIALQIPGEARCALEECIVRHRTAIIMHFCGPSKESEATAPQIAALKK